MTMFSATPLSLAVLSIVLAAPSAHAAWHDEHSGQDVQAHYVKLTGHGGNNARNRQLLLEEYTACANINPKLGLPVKPLPATGIPDIISSHVIDIYYAPGRTIAVSSGALHTLNRNDCGVEAHEHATLKFLGPEIDTCEVDLIRRKVKGICGTTTASTRSQTVLSQLPPEKRKEALKQLERVKQTRFVGPSAGQLPGTGTYRVISGLRCEVYRQPPTGMELCIARPDSAFPIPASVYNAAVPGLLLSARSEEIMTVTASEVRLGIGLSEKAFAIPSDIVRKVKGQ